MKKKMLGMLLSGAMILSMIGCGSVAESPKNPVSLNTGSEDASMVEVTEAVTEESVENTGGEIPVIAQTVADLLIGHDQIQYVDVTTEYTEHDILAYQVGEAAYLPDLYKLVDVIHIGDVTLDFEEFFCNPMNAWEVIDKVGATYPMSHDYWTAEDYEGLEEGKTLPTSGVQTVVYEAGTSRTTYQEHGCPLRYEEEYQDYYFYVRFGDDEGNPTDEIVFIIETSVDDPNDVYSWGAYYRTPADDASTHCVMHTVDDQYIMLPYLMESGNRDFTYDVLK